MKKHILIFVAITGITYSPVYNQSTDFDFDAGDFYDWFQSHSNASALYTDQSTLYTFAEETPVFAEPCETATPIDILKRGQSLTNRAYEIEDFIPTAEMNGYHDMWYQITLTSGTGIKRNGYIWGGHIAKAWLMTDINQDGETEFILLGVSERPRRQLRDIRAAIVVLKSDTLLSVTEIPGMCVFEACTSDALLFAGTDVEWGIPFLEASTLSIGCMANIERSILIWKGDRLECIYYGEMTTRATYKKEDFAVRQDEKTSTRICHFQGFGADFLPIWSCKERASTRSAAVIP